MKKILFVALLLVSSLHASVTSQTDKSATVVITALPQVVPATFPFQASADLQVLDFGSVATPRDPAVILTLGSDYTVTGGGYNNANQMQLGSVVVASGGAHLVLVNDRLIVRRNVPINQITSFMTTGPLTMKQAEQALDKQATLSQQINEVTTRSLQFENFETLSPILSLASRKGMLLGFDATGAIAYTPSGTTPGAYVSKIIAGTNITISPTTGIGDVTINSSGGGGSGTINAGTVNNLAYYSGSTAINSFLGTTISTQGLSFNYSDTSKTYLGLFNSSSGGQNWEIRSNGSASGRAGALSFYNSSGVGEAMRFDSSGASTFAATETIDLSSGGTIPALQSAATTSFRTVSSGVQEHINWGTSLAIVARSASGTRASPTATTDGFTILSLYGEGYDTAFTTSSNGAYQMFADGLWSGSNHGTYHSWSGTPNGSTTQAAWMTLKNGNLSTFNTNIIDLGTGTLPTAGLPSSAVPALRIAQANSSINGIEGLAWNGVTGLYLLGTSAGGTRASPLATIDGTAMSVLAVRGHNGTSYTGTGAGGVVINADGTWSGSNQGTKFNIIGTASGQTSNAVWFTLQNGSLQLPLGGYRSTGPTITDANALAALAIDVTKGLNTKTVAADSTFTFSAAPAVSNTYFTLRLTNSDTNPHVITIPSTFDSNSQQTITSFNILAGGVETISWCYDGTNYIAYGVPSSGSSAEVTVASATSTAIGAASSLNVAISGTTTITGFGTVSAGTYRVGRFTGILTLSYNATSMILPNGGSNITTAAGDTFGARSEGSGNWRVLWYQPFTRASGTGTVTATGGSLTANSVVLGAGTTDTKVAAGITTDGTSKLTLGVAGTSVGSVDFKNATSGTATLAPPTGALGTFQVTLPNAASTLPIFGQQITFAGPTAARTVTLPDAAFTVARTDAANTFTGVQTFSTVIAGTSGGTGVNNSTRTMTYAGNVAFTGAFNVSFTVPGAFTYTLPGATDTLVGRTSTDTLTNKRVTARVGTVTSSATPTINTDNVDMFTITAQAVAITSMTTNLSGTPAEGDQLLIRFKDNGSAQTIAWGASYQSIGGTLPTTTVAGKILYVLLIWNVAAAKWDCVSTSQQ